MSDCTNCANIKRQIVNLRYNNDLLELRIKNHDNFLHENYTTLQLKHEAICRENEALRIMVQNLEQKLIKISQIIL